MNGPLGELLRSLQDPSTAPQRVQALATQLAISLQGSGSRKYLRDSHKLAAEHSKTIAKRRKGLAVYPFGIKELDQYGAGDTDEAGNSLAGKPLLVPGAAPGKTTVVTAISGGGKSTIVALMALQMARMAQEADDQGLPHRKILYGAWEMGAEETLELMACISAKISRNRVRTGNITDAEHALLTATMDALAGYVKFVDMPFHKERSARRTHAEVLDEIHGYIADSGCEIAIFDLWRRAFAKLRDESEEAEALYRQQAIFEETGVHGILVQQQRLKDVETRQNARPTREGIKGSSAWVDVADLILGIYIPALMQGTKCNTLETLILKQRYGRWPLAIEHTWDGDLVKLSNGHIVAYTPGSEEELGNRGGANPKRTADQFIGGKGAGKAKGKKP